MNDNSLAAVIPWRQFHPSGEGEVDLRNNGLMVGYNLYGPPPERSDLAQLAGRVRQIASAMVHLSSRDAVHVIWHRIPAPPPPTRHFNQRACKLVNDEFQAQFEADRQDHWLTISRMYLSHQYETAIKGLMRSTLAASRGPQQSQRELLREYTLKRFAAFEDAARGAVSLSRLSSLEMFRSLLMNVSYNDFPAAVPEAGARINQVIGSERFIGGQAPWINGYHLRPICLTAYPSMTVPQLLAILLQHRGEMTVCARFLCLDPYDAKAALEVERHHWHRELFGTVWQALKQWFDKGQGQKRDDDTHNQLADIDQAIAASQGGMSFGRVTVTAIIRDRDEGRVDLRAHEMLRECHSAGIVARIEDINAVEAIMGTWPGMVDENIRRPLMTAVNFADLVLPATHWIGTPYLDNPVYPEATPTPLITGGKGDLSPFYYPVYINGVAHQIIIGPTGTGKSSLLGAMAASYLGIPNARLAWLDLDHSAFVLAHLLGADYHDLGARDSTPLCPLACLDDENGVDWLCRWFERMFQRWHDLQLNERQFEDLNDALSKAKREGIRDLKGFRALIYGGEEGRDRMRRILEHCIRYWGHIFDGKPSDKGDAQVTVYELRGLTELGKQAAAPATELILHNIVSQLRGQPAWILADEFWSLLGDEISATWLFDVIRTLRKKNTGFIGCTQSLVEIVNSPYRDLLLESCPGKVFLPNSEAATSYVRDSYRKMGLSDHEIAIIAGARPQSEYYYRASLGSRLFKLQLGPVGQAIAASTSYQDVQLARHILDESHDREFLDVWLDSREQGLPISYKAQTVKRRRVVAIANQ